MLMSSHVCTEMEVLSTHLDWTIRCHQVENAWRFEATQTQSGISFVLADDFPYTSVEAALMGARFLIETRTLRDRLGAWIDELKDGGRISQSEYDEALNVMAATANCYAAH
jgi:hypothetical protein